MDETLKKNAGVLSKARLWLWVPLGLAALLVPMAVYTYQQLAAHINSAQEVWQLRS